MNIKFGYFIMSINKIEIKKKEFLYDLNCFLDSNEMKYHKNLKDLVIVGDSLKNIIENSGKESFDNQLFLQLVNFFLENHKGLNKNEQIKGISSEI